jgi:dipeptidyl aminopeptidase/acylaminoacyl peptidase
MSTKSFVVRSPAGSRAIGALTVVAGLLAGQPGVVAAQRPGAAPVLGSRFTIAQVLSNPYPSNLVAAPAGSRIAWVFNQEGRRNIWVAQAPDWRAVQLTQYAADDGQELTNLGFTADGGTVVYVRGGDHDANWPAEGGLAPDPSSSPAQPKVEIWAVPVGSGGRSGGSAPRLVAEGDEPVVSPTGDRVVFTRAHQLWVVPVNGSAPAKQLFFARGESTAPVWSPDGSRLAFVSNRGDHSFVGIYSDDTTAIVWLAPSSSRDLRPRWSPDGTRVAFVRIPGQGGAPETLLDVHPRPWSIWVADARTGEGRVLWKSPTTVWGSVPTTDGGPNLHWAAGGRIVFLSDLDGWPHLYSIPQGGGEPVLLTPGRFMAEFIALAPDRRTIVYAANTGPDTNDVDRRHLFRVPVDRAAPQLLTPGDGVEWTPVVTGDGGMVAYIAAGAKAPPLPAVIPLGGGAARLIGGELVPADFPTAQLVVPRKVVFRAADGTLVHGQLFEHGNGMEGPGGLARKPAVVFVHGGPPRQMLLGWHYMDYYSNAYAMNQYLASRGYVVLSVNYRLGIGYGHDFHHPAHWGPWGESEYQDVKAGGEYLRGLPEVDSARIGIWGGSYGGLLTALALARNSDLFKTGVDLHGVHDWTRDLGIWLDGPLSRPYEPGDAKQALDIAWQSSPVSHMSSWRSPVLLIQGDDDRNVRFHQTVDLVRRLEAQGVRYEELVLPDEIHGFLRHASWFRADEAMAGWFDREFHMRVARVGGRMGGGK